MPFIIIGTDVCQQLLQAYKKLTEEDKTRLRIKNFDNFVEEMALLGLKEKKKHEP